MEQTLLDPELVERVRNLKLEFKSTPQPELLISMPYKPTKVEEMVELNTVEFTSLCPLNLSQPDYATLAISYIPVKLVVELKSLKFYLASFRMVPIFHEVVPATILETLVDLLEPKFLLVTGDFTIRGGIHTTVVARHGKLE